MLYLNGVAYSRFNRLTWDGKSKAGIAVDQSKADGTSVYFDTANEYADDTFTDVGIGIRGGYLGYGFAETSVLRSHFIRNSQAGISLGNFNALDLFVWNSTFENCNIGVTNNLSGGAGNFNIYNSIFKRSGYADVYIGNTGSFSLRNNFSINSNAFFVAGVTGNPATITLQGNMILDPVADGAILGNPAAIINGNLGPVFLIDNVIRSLAGVTTQQVVNIGLENADIFSIGNKYTSTNPLQKSTSGRLHSIDDQTVTRASITTGEPTLPGTPANLSRQVFEVSPGSSAATIQGVINTAAAQNGSRPIVHLPPTTLAVNTTLVIPANTDLQIVGDGGASVIKWNGSGAGPIFRLDGPSKATLRDFALNGGGTADGIVVENADQSGSRVFMEQPYLQNYTHNLFVNGLDYTNVQLQDFYHNGYGANTRSIKVVGGPSTAAGTWLGGKTTIFAGASSNSLLSYEVLQGAHVSVRDIWYETSGSFSKFIRLAGESTFSFSGAKVAVVANPGPMVDIVDFTGKATLLESTMHGNVVISGNGSQAKVLGIGLSGSIAELFR